MTYEDGLERERRKLTESSLSEDSKEKILEFIDDLSLQKISAGRRYAYILRLRKIAEIIPNEFLNPETKDIKKVVRTVSTTKVRWGGGELHEPSDNAIQAYSVTLKRFYKWLLTDDRKYPECVEWLKTTVGHKSREKKPETNITAKEVDKLLEGCRNARDKALISLLYDSGCRISELLSMRIKDLAFDKYGAMISVTGKTGFRKVRVVGNSIAYIRSWLSNHPKSTDENAWLFTELVNFNNQMDYPEVRNMLKKAAERVGITRRVYPHLFRHTRATLLASKIGEAPLEKHMGWVHGSKMSQTYVHLSGKDVDGAILCAYGVKMEDEDKPLEEERPIMCPRCETENPSNSKVCRRCWLPLDHAVLQEFLEKEALTVETLRQSDNVSGAEKELLETVLDNPEARSEFVRIILKGAKESGSFESLQDEIRRRLSKEGN